MNSIIHISFAGGFYRYRGYFFELHTYFGYIPLRKDGEPSLRTPSGFWDAIDKFRKESDREKFRLIP